MVIEEDESGVAAGAHRRARNGEVGRIFGNHRGSMHRHGSEHGSEIVEKVLKDLQLAQALALLAELAQRRLEVVGLDGHVIGVTGRLRFLKSSQLAVGIFSALKHVRSVEIDARADHDGNQGGNVLGLDDGPAVVGDFVSSAHLCGHIWQQRRGFDCSGRVRRITDGSHVRRRAAVKAKRVDLGRR